MTNNFDGGGVNGVIQWLDPNTGSIWNINSIYANSPSNTSNTSALTLIGRDAGSNVSKITVGGASTATGLWVGSSNILFNNAPLGGGGSSISNAGATVACDSTGSINGTTVAMLTTEVSRINFTTNSLASTAVGSNPGDIGSINFNTNLGGSNTTGGNYGGNITYDVGSSCSGGFYPPQVLPVVSSSNVGVFELGGTDVVMKHNGTYSNANGVITWEDPNAGNIWNMNTIYANTPSNTSNTSALTLSGRDSGSNVSKITVGGASTTTGLWVGSSNILFNNAPLGGGSATYFATNGINQNTSNTSLGTFIVPANGVAQGTVYSFQTLSNTAGGGFGQWNGSFTTTFAGNSNTNVVGFQLFDTLINGSNAENTYSSSVPYLFPTPYVPSDSSSQPPTTFQMGSLSIITPPTNDWDGTYNLCMLIQDNTGIGGLLPTNPLTSSVNGSFLFTPTPNASVITLPT